MKLILPVLMNIALVIGVYLLGKKGKLKNVSNTKLQVIIGILFGGIACFASSFGEEVLGVVVNVRDASPIVSGLIFGPISGIISGFIGGIYRAFSVLWGATEYTVVACSISTIVAGITAALLRKYMFDNKIPTVTYAVGITIVLEVFHMLMIFITNFNDANTAFAFVKECTVLMAVANSIAVGVSIFAVTLINRDFKLKKEKDEKGIADTFQVWLFVSIIIAFLATSIFTYNIQSVMSSKQIQDVFTVSTTDIYLDIQNESDKNLEEIVKQVKGKYEDNEDVDLKTLLVSDSYEICEINIVNDKGFINKSSETDYKDFDMNSDDQSREFLSLINKKEDTILVQKYGPNGLGENRKYAGITLENGWVLQVGYNADQFHGVLDIFVRDAIKNRHVGVDGFILICDENLTLVSNDEYDNKHISEVGIIPNEEMLTNTQASEIYNANISFRNNEEYIYVFAFAEGYCIVTAMPLNEAMLIRDASMYLSIFMQTLIFAILFVLIFYLIKKIIVNNLHTINKNLAEITGGNLNVQVNVRTSEEFSSLSDDINLTVSTLKRYIAEAAARIDKELEYAKQIQLSALPVSLLQNDALNINAAMMAAKEVGGDFYDYYYLDDKHIAFLVADVSGKGIPAAMFMMTSKTIIKDLAEAGLDVNEIFNRANEKLCENNESGMFVTAWMGILNIETGVLKYANAGHNPPLVLNKNGEFEYIKTRAGFVLGGMEGVRYRVNELTLEKGDRVFLYTDGVSEATNVNQELFGEDRLINFFNQNKDLNGKSLLPALKNHIDEFVGEAPQFDDITMLILDYNKTSLIIKEEVFKADDQELPKVLSLLEEELEKYNCPMKVSMSICVAIEEIFVNIAHYAYKDNQGECKMIIEFNEETRNLVITLMDNGLPFNPLNRPDPDITKSADEREIGGLGIYITKQTMDNVIYKYENDTNILIMKKKI